MLTKSMAPYHIFALIVIIILSLVHYISAALGKANWIWHGRFLSCAGGVSISYVFVELLPKLSRAQSTVSSTGFLPFFEKHVYLLALVGLLVFYSVEQINYSKRGLFQSLAATKNLYEYRHVSQAVLLTVRMTESHRQLSRNVLSHRPDLADLWIGVLPPESALQALLEVS